jgi:hypothetical protein
MDKRQNTLGKISLLIFALGILLGMLVAGTIVWGDLEASLFDASMRPNATLDSLNCPVAITENEIGNISITLENPTERDKTYFVRAHTSAGFVSLKRETNQQISVAANGTEEVEWAIFPDDAAYSRFVLFRVFVAPSAPFPSQGNFCGVPVVNIPFLTGTQVFILLLGLSLGAAIGGTLAWRKIHHPMSAKARSMASAMTALTVVVFGTILVAYLGIWMLGIVLFAISILMIGVIFGRNILSL